MVIMLSFGNAASKNNNSTANNEISEESPIEKADTLKWIDDFRAFREAVYHNERAKVKGFMDFPLVSPANEIWYIAYEGEDKKMSALPDSSKPFTEKDFDKYYSKLFTNKFIKCLLKIKTEDFYREGGVNSPEYKEGDVTTSLSVTVDKSDNTLTLNLITKTFIKVGDGEFDPVEGNLIFQFRIWKSGKIKLKLITAAG